MNFLKKFTCTAAVIAALSTSAVAQLGDEIEVAFGGMYNPSTPTTVVSGSGTLGSSLVGGQFYWACLDATQDQPSFTTSMYTVSTDPAVLQAGTWGGTLDADARMGIITAATNMFYAYQNELLTSPNDEIGYGYQSALWGVTFAYLSWGATGPLSSSVVDEVISRYNIYFEEEPWLELFLNAALTTPTGETEVYFANPTDNPDLQPVMLFAVAPVPEPSGAVLVALAGMAALVRRRRSA